MRHVEPIEVEVDGKRHRCFYAMQSNMVTVWHADLGSRTAMFEGAPTHVHVESLTRDLVQPRRTCLAPGTDPLR